MGVRVEDYRQEGGRWFCIVESADMLLMIGQKLRLAIRCFAVVV